jgi:hypothetical protein
MDVQLHLIEKIVFVIDEVFFLEIIITFQSGANLIACSFSLTTYRVPSGT